MKSYPCVKLLIGLSFISICGSFNARAGWLDFLKPATESNSTATAAGAALSVLSQSDVASGLKEALSQGVNHAIALLGKDGGFLNNADVKIPMPADLQKIEKLLRKAGQDNLADEFVATMNHAAEQAVPLAASVFAGAITNMTVTDAQSILSGSSNAATLYFQKTSQSELQEKFLPIVKEATEKAGVTAAYKKMLKEAGPLASFLGSGAGDLDGYITQKSLDGLFKMVAAEEARIRENPAARTTDLLKKVFSSQAAK